MFTLCREYGQNGQKKWNLTESSDILTVLLVFILEKTSTIMINLISLVHVSIKITSFFFCDTYTEVTPPSNGYFGTNINSSCLSTI